MSDVAIKVENLGKRYFIRHEKKESYETFQDVLINGGKKIITLINPFDRSSRQQDETVEEFWALKDVNFDITKVVLLLWIKIQGKECSTIKIY